jgi:hypothetical protein
VWHKEGAAIVKWNSSTIANLKDTNAWAVDTISLAKTNFSVNKEDTITITATGSRAVYLDDIIAFLHRRRESYAESRFIDRFPVPLIKQILSLDDLVC